MIDAGRSFVNSAVIAVVTTAGILVTSLLAGFAFAEYRVPRPQLAVRGGPRHYVPAANRDADPAVPHSRISAAQRQPRRGHPAEPRQRFRHLSCVSSSGASRTNSSMPPVSMAPPNCAIIFPIVAPSVVPAIAALALFAFVYHWNSYLWPLTVLQGQTSQYPIVHQPFPPALLQPRRYEHRPDHGRSHDGSAAAAHDLHVAAALRHFDRELGGQGMTTTVLAIDLGGTNMRAALAPGVRPAPSSALRTRLHQNHATTSSRASSR